MTQHASDAKAMQRPAIVKASCVPLVLLLLCIDCGSHRCRPAHINAHSHPSPSPCVQELGMQVWFTSLAVSVARPPVSVAVHQCASPPACIGLVPWWLLQ